MDKNTDCCIDIPLLRQEFVVASAEVHVYPYPSEEDGPACGLRLQDETVVGYEETFDGWVHDEKSSGWILRRALHVNGDRACLLRHSGAVRPLATSCLAKASGPQTFEVVSPTPLAVRCLPSPLAEIRQFLYEGAIGVAELQNYSGWIRLVGLQGWVRGVSKKRGKLVAFLFEEKQPEACGSELTSTSEQYQLRPLPSKVFFSKLRCRLNRLQKEHCKLLPQERHARSWARTLAFAKMTLTLAGQPIERGWGKPFVVWVLGATQQVEGHLVGSQLLTDTNFLDPVPTEVNIFGAGLPHVRASGGSKVSGRLPTNRRLPTQQSSDLQVRMAPYEVLQKVINLRRPDMIAVLMPDICSKPCSVLEHDAQGFIPDEILTSSTVANAPAVVSTRFAFSEATSRDLESKLGKRLLLSQTRCPFSAAGWEGRDLEYDDNGWFCIVQGHGALAAALGLEVEDVHKGLAQKATEKEKALFWGILDVKYNPNLPVGERVKILETGDGSTSKFSGHGAYIFDNFATHYQEDPEHQWHQKYRFFSQDKKLTHDMMEQAGYAHLVPKQVCCHRCYNASLADSIVSALAITEPDFVVLKLCNRYRGAGVLCVPLYELSETLKDLLTPPADVQAWFAPKLTQLSRGSAADFHAKRDTFEEHKRHWWSNEDPVFVAEKFCSSIPINKDGKHFDGTLRVAFVICQKPQCEGARNMGAADLQIKWLGGYWKLPLHDINCKDSSLRERTISKGAASTAPVSLTNLYEVFAAIGDSMQQLFAAKESSVASLTLQYSQDPALLAYLVAKLGTHLPITMTETTYELLETASRIIEGVRDCPHKLCVMSFVMRVKGALDARKSDDPGRWARAQEWFQNSLNMRPVNSNALYNLGLALLEQKKLHEATELLSKSLLLDADFLQPYVLLGVSYMKLGKYIQAVQVSEACLARFPDAHKADYHLGAASYHLALVADGDEYEQLREKAIRHLSRARPIKEKSIAGWAEEEEEMLKTMRLNVQQSNMKDKKPKRVKTWKSTYFRI